jgi:hypothetical protein
MALEKAYEKSYGEGGESPEREVAAALADGLKNADPSSVSGDAEMLRFMAACFQQVDNSALSAKWYLRAFEVGGSPELDAVIASWNRLAVNLFSVTLHAHFLTHGDEGGLTQLLTKIRERVRAHRAHKHAAAM